MLLIQYILTGLFSILLVVENFCKLGHRLTQLKALVKLFPDAVTRKMPVAGYILNISDPFEGALLYLTPLGPEVSDYFAPRRFVVPIMYKVIGRLCHALFAYFYQRIPSSSRLFGIFGVSRKFRNGKNSPKKVSGTQATAG